MEFSSIDYHYSTFLWIVRAELKIIMIINELRFVIE